jgi:LacI family transcriptional regulator
VTHPQRPTLRQVAEIAAVGVKTASRALNGEPGVAPETLARVRAAASSIGFRPNALARELRSQRRSTTVGLVIGDLANPFYALIAAGVERTLTPLGLQLITASHEESPDRERRIVRALVERRVEALLLVPAGGDGTYLAAELALGLQVVALDRPLPGVDVDTVVLDNRGGTAEAVHDLLDQGHRRIGFVGDDERVWTIRERLAGFTAALLAQRVQLDPDLVRTGAHEAGVAERHAAALLALPEPPTAIFASNNIALLGCLRAVRRTGARIHLVGFDRFEVADVLAAPVSIVENDPAEMGRVAARFVIDRRADSQAPPRTIVLPTRLVHPGRGATVRRLDRDAEIGA